MRGQRAARAGRSWAGEKPERMEDSGIVENDKPEERMVEEWTPPLLHRSPARRELARFYEYASVPKIPIFRVRVCSLTLQTVECQRWRDARDGRRRGQAA